MTPRTHTYIYTLPRRFEFPFFPFLFLFPFRYYLFSCFKFCTVFCFCTLSGSLQLIFLEQLGTWFFFLAYARFIDRSRTRIDADVLFIFFGFSTTVLRDFDFADSATISQLRA
ncbi:hypothetical protein C8F04DRAFT_1130593 [Mycena alexandri]|uniref:Uncharacterized protein n=1 Tax=Mycena alexandri TaxID=1745969 RepID=A0AAD6SEV8_9AGAR|nr:hypothetical protein C8F04DRAFT_1130593 [Mycena alexandri]